MYKYIVLFPIPEPSLSSIKNLMNIVADQVGMAPLYTKLIPHVTFHRPIAGIDEKVIKNLVHSISLQMRKTHISVHRISSFGKQYIVLPVQAPFRANWMWVNIHNTLSVLPEYEHNALDFDNTLHITLAEKTSKVYDEAWPKIELIHGEFMTIPVERIVLYRKLISGGEWEEVTSYPIPD